MTILYRIGDRSAAIAKLQKRFSRLYRPDGTPYYSGPITKHYDEHFSASVRQFQENAMAGHHKRVLRIGPEAGYGTFDTWTMGAIQNASETMPDSREQ